MTCGLLAWNAVPPAVVGNYMSVGKRELVVVVRPGERTGAVLGWLRQLLPAAILLVAPLSPGVADETGRQALVLESDEIDSPMSLADALARHGAGGPRHGGA